MWEALKRATTRPPCPPVHAHSPGGFRCLPPGAGAEAEEKGGGTERGRWAVKRSFSRRAVGPTPPLKGRSPEKGRPRPEPGGFARLRGRRGVVARPTFYPGREPGGSGSGRAGSGAAVTAMWGLAAAALRERDRAEGSGSAAENGRGVKRGRSAKRLSQYLAEFLDFSNTQ